MRIHCRWERRLEITRCQRRLERELENLAEIEFGLGDETGILF